MPVLCLADFVHPFDDSMLQPVDGLIKLRRVPTPYESTGPGSQVTIFLEESKRPRLIKNRIGSDKTQDG